jgi:hypothetical protein
MTQHYRSLDRRTATAIFFASLVIAVTLLSSVTTAFGPMLTNSHSTNTIEEVIVQG